MARVSTLMQITNSKTFCPAPWTSLNIDQTGHVMPCMHSGYGLGNIKAKSIQEILADKPLHDLRQTIAQGEWHEACALCKELEESSGGSGRTVRYATAESIEKINNDIEWFEPQHLTINWSNLCNLTCVYCNPQTSTAWQGVKKIPIQYVRNEQQSLIELAKSNGKSIQGLTLGGGEPLLQKGLVEFLRHLDPAKVNVLVTTNLSVDITNNEVYQELRNWPNVDWQVSFDNCTKEKFEYVRHGASWDILLANIRIMKQHGQRVAAHPAYSIYCAFDLIEYYEFCEAEDLNIFWCELTHPWDLDIRRMSLDLRNKAIEEIDRVIVRWAGCDNLATGTLARYKKQLVDTSYLFDIFPYELDTLGFHSSIEEELNKPTRFVDLWPELAERIKHVQ